MITEIPNANFYSLSPISSPSTPVAVGGLAMMNAVGKYLTNNDIVLITGISDEECMIMVKQTFEEIASMVDVSKVDLDNAIKGASDVA